MSSPTIITAIKAAQRLDSRGKPTVQVRITTSDGIFPAIVPSGASTGEYEALELRDGNKDAFEGNGVLNAVYNVENVLGPAVMEKKFDIAKDLKAIDELMIHLDGTEDKSKLGANAILGISMACARASAAANVRSDVREGRLLTNQQRMPLYELIARESGTPSNYVMPVPFFNVLNGGVHSGNTMPFQEFMIAPVDAGSMAGAVQMGAEVYQELKGVITDKFGKSGRSSKLLSLRVSSHGTHGKCSWTSSHG
jgi:enolase